MTEAARATRDYQHVMTVIADAGIERNISLKLTQLGLDIDRATSVDNLRRILDSAQQGGFFVRIDMENSPYTDATLDIFETVWTLGYRNVGVVLQSCLRRSEDDLRRVNALGGARAARQGRVQGAGGRRLPDQERCRRGLRPDDARSLLAEGTFPAIATHDPRMIEETKTFASQHGIAPDRFEFQMLYGIRRDLQARAARTKATACASTCRSAANGSPTSCAASANGRPTCCSCSRRARRAADVVSWNRERAS